MDGDSIRGLYGPEGCVRFWFRGADFGLNKELIRIKNHLKYLRQDM